MGLPRKLKHLNVFNEGVSFVGEVVEVTLPNLAKKTEEFRSGGMAGPVETVLGHEGITFEHAYGGYMREVMKQMGVIAVDGVMLRFAGSYQRGDSSEVDSVEVIVRGFHKELDRGSAKSGEDTEFKVTTPCSYYKEICNGETLVEIDVLNMVWIVDGVDLLAAHRSAIGL